MNSLIKKLQNEPLLNSVISVALKDKCKVYLVGGYLRDIILNREKKICDFDFTLKRGAINFAKIIAKEIKGSFVLLDKQHGCARVVYNENKEVYTLDFTDFRGKDIKEDLLRRDFSINSLAVDISRIKKADDLFDIVIDYYGGLKDLKNKKINIIRKKSFSEDPLRIIRAFSLSCLLGFKITKATLLQIKRDRLKIDEVAFERIRDELFKILDSQQAFGHLKMMDDMAVLEMIIPEIKIMSEVKQGPYHHLDVWQHSLEATMQLEGVIKEFNGNPKIHSYLNEVTAYNRNRSSLMKLGVLLHDIGKPQSAKVESGRLRFHGHEHIGKNMVKRISERLKLSTKEKDSLEKMILWHLRPGYLANFKRPTQRAVFRYFRDTSSEGISVLLIALADQRATKGPLANTMGRKHHEKIIKELIDYYFHKQEEKKPPRLITGSDLIRKLKLKPSPLFGKILSRIEEAQAIGKIKTKIEALELAKKSC